MGGMTSAGHAACCLIQARNALHAVIKGERCITPATVGEFSSVSQPSRLSPPISSAALRMRSKSCRNKPCSQALDLHRCSNRLSKGRAWLPERLEPPRNGCCCCCCCCCRCCCCC